MDAQIIHTCGTLGIGMIAHLHVAQGNKHDTFTVKKAKEKKYLRNIAARRNYQYNLVNAMENNAKPVHGIGFFSTMLVIK